jgi:hypothetical protein
MPISMSFSGVFQLNYDNTYTHPGTTIVGALAFLAERPRLQKNLKEGILSGKDVVHETLRILPPVSGLPRIPTACDLDLTLIDDATDADTTTDNVKSRRCPISPSIPKDQTMVIDLLAFAHAQPHNIEEEENPKCPSTNSETIVKLHNRKNHHTALPTLKFDPMNRIKSQAQPWGIGKRKCPAGIISVECISAVIEALAKEGFTWRFVDSNNANATRDRTSLGSEHEHEHYGGWMTSISYRPTLTFASPILLDFIPAECVASQSQSHLFLDE